MRIEGKTVGTEPKSERRRVIEANEIVNIIKKDREKARKFFPPQGPETGVHPAMRGA